MSEITFNDYKKILEFYNKPIPKSKRLLKLEAEKIMATKLCRCIKKMDTGFEQKAIGICTKTIFNRKGYTRGKFKCKGKKFVTFRKTTTSRKTRKNNK
jgi:hypothetical protein